MPMKAPAYVLDTHVLVWFAKGHAHKLGLNSLMALLGRRARIVVPSYALEEVQRQFSPSMRAGKDMLVPPTPLLRLILKCLNARVLPRGPALLAEEFRLHKRHSSIPVQDIPIAAAVLVAKKYYDGPVLLATCDRELKRWAGNMGIPVSGPLFL